MASDRHRLNISRVRCLPFSLVTAVCLTWDNVFLQVWLFGNVEAEEFMLSGS